MEKNLPDGWKWEKIDNVAKVNIRRDKKKPLNLKELTSFIPMDSVDDITGKITKPLLRPYEELGESYTYFENGDIIFAKITPCMQNGKCAIVEGMKDDFGFGSSEYIVLTPQKNIYRKWVYYFLRTAEFRKDAEEHFTGSAGQQRVPPDFVQKYQIPIPIDDRLIENILPCLDEKIIVAGRMRQIALQQKEAAEALQGALLREVFPYKEGDELPKGWKWEKIGNIMDEDRTQVQPYGEDFKQLPFIGLENILSNTRQYTDEEYNPPTSTCFKFSSKHILYGKLRPYLNKVFLPSADGKCSMEILPLIPKNGYSREFIAAVLQSEAVIGNTVKFSTGGRMPRADIKKLRKLSVAIPADSEECNRLGGRVAKKIESLIKFNEQSSKQLEAIEVLPTAILREVFEFKNY